MTENEVKSKLDSLHYKIIHTSFCNKVYESEIEALCLAKDLLQEIQQYRAIGTIEELKKIKESFNVISDKVWNYILAGEELLERYEAIGTIDKFKDLKEKNTKKRFNIFESHGMRQFVCGCCDRPILTTDNYCSFCGQKLDWQ